MIVILKRVSVEAKTVRIFFFEEEYAAFIFQKAQGEF